jgi:hypothetical protein
LIRHQHWTNSNQYQIGSLYYCACYILLATLGNNNPWSLKTATVVIFCNGMICVGIPKQEKTVLKYLQFNIFFIFWMDNKHFQHCIVSCLSLFGESNYQSNFIYLATELKVVRNFFKEKSGKTLIQVVRYLTLQASLITSFISRS